MTRRGFTLIELLVSVIITAIMMTVCFITFNTAIRCWSRSAAVADTVRNAEYALTQVISGLRSAYYPTTGKQDYAYGFQLYDNGEDPEDSDTIQWVKLGTSIVGNRSQLSETPHTVRVWVQKEGRDGPGGLWVKAGELDLHLLADDPDGEVDFNDDEQFEPYPLIEGIQGFDCKVQSKPDSVESDGTPKWEDTWDTSNSIPYRVKLTFWMTPAKETGEPVPIMRVVEIPIQLVSFFIIVWEMPKGAGQIGIINQSTEAGWLPVIGNRYLLTVLVAAVVALPAACRAWAAAVRRREGCHDFSWIGQYETNMLPCGVAGRTRYRHPIRVSIRTM